MDTQSEDANFPLHNWVSPTKLLASKDWYQISDPLIKGISPWILGIAFWDCWIVGVWISERNWIDTQNGALEKRPSALDMSIFLYLC